MPKKEIAKILYETTGESVSEIAKRAGVNANTLKSWIRREKWEKEIIQVWVKRDALIQ